MHDEHAIEGLHDLAVAEAEMPPPDTTDTSLANALLAARARAGLTHDELAQRLGTTRAMVVRLEAGRVRPTLRTLERYARVTGTRLRVCFEVPERAA